MMMQINLAVIRDGRGSVSLFLAYADERSRGIILAAPSWLLQASILEAL
uniref:Uncharacterized protein n=1 Tax=Manihot esculenta TaxID=3983 RepID=A0A2C9U7P0_MANES